MPTTERVQQKSNQPRFVWKEPMSSFSNRPLVQHDVFRDIWGDYHLVQYVNSSGAYAVALSSVTRQIGGRDISFTAGGRTISAYSIVEIVNPLVMGGNSQEYQRYVRMVEASGKADISVAGTTFDSFDSTELPVGADNLDDTDSIPTVKGMTAMAKAAKAKAPKTAKAREKTPKTVRNCVCGCGTETTGYFAPGHDARYHGWITKLADGRIQRNGKDAKSGEQIVGAALLNKMGLVAKGEGFKANSPEFYKS